MTTEDEFATDHPSDPDWLKNLRKEHREFKKQLVDLPKLQRENAVLKAGIDMSNPVAELFVEAYKGDLTVEAIKEAAAKYGLADAPDAEGGEGGGEEQRSEIEALAAIDEAARGGGKPAGKTPDYMQAQSKEDFIAQYRAAGGIIADQ